MSSCVSMLRFLKTWLTKLRKAKYIVNHEDARCTQCLFVCNISTGYQLTMYSYLHFWGFMVFPKPLRLENLIIKINCSEFPTKHFYN